MKRTAFSLAIILLTCRLYAGIVEKTYTFAAPSIEVSGGYHTLSFPNTMLSAMPGDPLIPYLQVKLLLPPGEEAERIEYQCQGEIKLFGSFKLAPQQHVRPVSQGSSGQFILNESVYLSNDEYPVSRSGRLITSFMNGHSIALSTITPVKYHPATGELSYYSNIRVIVYTKSTETARQALANLKSAPQVLETLQRYCDNPDQASLYDSDQHGSTDPYQILIITPSSYSGSFESLKSAYLKEGLLSRVATTETIASSMTGLDLQEKIRNYIIQEYQQHDVEHVILGGDDELIPNRGFYCFVQSSTAYEDYGIPSDLYYCALDGNWNTNNDNKWGEPEEDDLLPELSVGRLSFSNPFELTRMIHKSHAYQFNPVPGEFQKVLMAGENLYSNPDTWGSDYLELLIGSRNDNGYSTLGIPETYAFNKMYDETTYWSGYDLIDQINQGYPMLHHSGHANETYVMKLSNWDITDANFSGADGINHNYSLVYTHGCLCGSFDFSDCIAEQMVSINTFAVAFVGNSRYGWFNEGQTEGPSAHIHREFVDALYTDKLNRLGRAHMESKIATAPWVTAPGQWEPGAIRWCFYDCNVLGDPVLAVWTNNPMDILTTYPHNLPTGSTAMDVTVSSSGSGVAGLTCVFLMNGVIIGQAKTDAGGSAHIIFNNPLSTAGEAELVVSGYNCTPSSYNISVTGTSGFALEPGKHSGPIISPNPVKDQLTLSYEHNSMESVIIQLVSGDGKAITLLENTSESAGSHTFRWDAGNLPAGKYYLKISIGNNHRSVPFLKQ